MNLSIKKGTIIKDGNSIDKSGMNAIEKNSDKFESSSKNQREIILTILLILFELSFPKPIAI